MVVILYHSFVLWVLLTQGIRQTDFIIALTEKRRECKKGSHQMKLKILEPFLLYGSIVRISFACSIMKLENKDKEPAGCKKILLALSIMTADHP